jgi:hypothetical protein
MLRHARTCRFTLSRELAENRRVLNAFERSLDVA